MVHDFRTGYVQRVVDAQLDDLMPQLPALLLDGPKVLTDASVEDVGVMVGEDVVGV